MFMSEKILYKAGWLWQDYVGAKWQNLSWANTGDDHASYVYPQGKNSKSSYKPKSLFYHYQIGNIDSSKYKIDKVDFVIVIGKFNSKSNPFPTVKVFSGDNNAPYKKSPIATISNPTFLKNHFDFDSYTLQFSVKGLTVAQLKNIIFEVDWGRSKISGSSTISVNRARIKVHYSLKTPKFSSYDSVSSNWCYTDETLTYKLTVKNTQERGSGSTTVKLPKGCTIVSHTGGGSWNNSNKTLSYTLDKGKSVTHTFKLKFSNIGMQYIKTENNGLYVSNLNTIQQVSVVKRQIVPEIVIDDTPKQRDDIITYNFYTSFAKEPSYFDVNIQGFKENHPYGLACFTLQVPNNVVLDEPIRLSTELLDENINIDSIIRDESFEKHGISVQVDDDTVCLNLDNDDEDFVVNLRFPIYCTNDDDALIKINNKYEDTLFINPVRKSIFDFVPTISRDKKYVQNSVNIGSAGIWTIRAKTSKRNFFDMKKDLLSINIEKLIAYIGCIPLTRGHQVGDEASVKNTLIENRHNNRAYYGKKGDFSEDIGMTLRLHPSDVATLEGLCELDKPIPIDTVPHIPDGDPLNHRGWAELHGVSGIKKINSFLYECKPEVTYLTHDLITRFGIDEGAKIASNSIEYVLGLTHNFNESLRNYFNISYYQFFNDVEDENGDYVGEYELEPDTNLKFNSLNKLSNRGNYDLKFRNILPALMSEDYDGNWGMAVRILDKLNGNVLFEHLYNNFKHYDFNDGMVLNECDVTSKLLNGDNYEIVNYDKLSLKYDGLASITELKKSGSYFNKIERDTYNMENNIVETFLYDNKDNAIVNGNVKVIITDNKGYYDKFNVLSDINGKIEFPLNLNNGRYNIKFVFDETDTYKGCEYTYSVLVEYETDELHFEYDETPTVITNNTLYTVKLVDENNVAKSGMIVYYSFKGLGDTNYSYESKLVTNSNGIVNIPINYTNGSKYLKVLFKGFIDNGVIYPSCYFETMVNINIEGKDSVIESDDIELNHGDNNKIYNIILKDAETNVGLSNKNVTISFYNDKENYNFDLVTNDFGVATLPIYLGVGNWFVDIHFKGDVEYKPNIVTRNIIINNFVKHDVNISSENLLLNENRLLNEEDKYYKITLKDENGNFIVNEPITFKVWSIDKENKYVDTILYSNDFGEISLPFVTHGENVIIESYYEGSNTYETAFYSDIVTFEEVLNKSDTTFSTDEEDVFINQNNHSTKVTKYREDYEGFDYDKRFTIIVTEPNNHRLSDNGALNLVGIQNEYTYNITIFYSGNDSYYGKCETFTFSPNRAYLPTSPDGRILFRYYLIEQGYPANDGQWTEDVESLGKLEVGELFKFRINFEFTHGKVPLYLGVGNADTIYTGFDNFVHNSDYVLKSMPIKYYNDDKYKEYVEFTGVMPSNGQFFLCCEDSKHHRGYGKHLDGVDDFIIIPSTKSKQSIIEEDGFGDNGETYQNMSILSLAEDNPSIDTSTNDYYLMKIFNNNTYEELFFYSYLDDIVTSSKLNFMISEDNWDLLLLGSGNDTYKSDYYILNNVIIDTPSEPVEPSIIDGIHDTVEVDNNLFFNENNYNTLEGNDIIIDESLNNLTIPSSSSSCLISNILPDYNYSLEFSVDDKGIFIFGYDGISDIDGTSNIDGISLHKLGYNWFVFFTENGIIKSSKNLGRDMSAFDVKLNVQNDLCTVYVNDILCVKNCNINTDILAFKSIDGDYTVSNIKLYEYNDTIDSFTESVDEYEGKTFGSDIYFELKNNTLNFIDYGMLPEGSNGVGKIVLNDIKLPESEYELEVEIIYGNNSFQRLNNLNGYLKFRSFEDISVLNNLKYNNILCSPVPISNSITRFTRHTDEGTMYYVETPLVDNQKVRPTYLCNPYIQYKGGTELNSENGISLFNLDNGFSPVSVDNGLVKCEFHRRSGYISIYRYDDITDMWYKCNTLKLSDNPQLELWKYTDDMCEIHFGNTIWKMWRGRPFIQIKHTNDDFRILNTVDKVYCETVENETNMGFVEEHDIFMGTFEPKTSIQLFKEEWNIGENIKTDNFKLYHIENHNIEDGNYDMNLNNVVDNGKKAIQITSSDSNHTIGLNFPASPVYVKKPASSFSLLIDNFKCYEGNHSYYVKCRGFDENGCINSVNNIQYGIWEDIKKVDLNGDFNTGETIRVSFNNVPNEVKYIDFIIEMPFYDGDEVILNDIMLYEGEDIEIEHKNDNSEFNASQVEIKFNETYYANLYDEDAPCGLCIVRPYKEKFTLKQLSRANETVLIPYMKKCSEWDKPENVFIEYFNSKEQIINVDWEN